MKECPNCQGENAEYGYVELWDGVCPECGRIVDMNAYTHAENAKLNLTPEQEQMIYERI